MLERDLTLLSSTIAGGNDLLERKGSHRKESQHCSYAVTI